MGILHRKREWNEHTNRMDGEWIVKATQQIDKRKKEYRKTKKEMERQPRHRRKLDKETKKKQATV